MKTLKPTEVKVLEQFFQLTQENLLKVMGKYLKNKYETIYFTKDYIVAVGDIPVALVAHLDTVFSSPPTNIFYDKVKNVMFSPDGLGADDRAGVYSIVQIIKSGLRPTIILTTDEERGALGATKLISDLPTAPTNLKYIVQLDRRGINDCVFYDCDNLEFETYIENFGFKTAYGTFSDISTICPKWGIAGVNLSIGYINEHSYSELLYVGNMIATIEKVIKMLKTVDDNVPEFHYIPRKFDLNAFDWDPSYGVSKALWDSWHITEDNQKQRCQQCQQEMYDFDLFPVKTQDGYQINLCSDCINQSKYINWCSCCYEPYFIEPNDDGMCLECQYEQGVLFNAAN